ncbi:TPA: hypothetical protein ACH3X3_012897 [Trebouxia sp. C0006]
MHISLWCKHTYPATTDDQREEHKKLHFALLSSKNGLDTTVKQTCIMYQHYIFAIDPLLKMVATLTHSVAAFQAGHIPNFPGSQRVILQGMSQLTKAASIQ